MAKDIIYGEEARKALAARRRHSLQIQLRSHSDPRAETSCSIRSSARR